MTYRLLETLARVVPAASRAVRTLVMTQVIALTPQTDQLLATSWAAVLTALPDEDWTQESATRAAATAGNHHPALATPLRKLGARYDHDVRQHLLQETGAGSLEALAALGDVRLLPPSVVTSMITSLAGHVDQYVHDAHNGSFPMGGHDVADTLVLLNLWHPTLAVWEPVTRLIRDGLVIGEHKHGALHRLTQTIDRVPDDQQVELLAAAQEAARQAPNPHRLLRPGAVDATGVAAELVTLLSQDAAANTRTLVELLGGDKNSRRSAARIAGRLQADGAIGVLLTLVHDAEPGVRATAAFYLAKMVTAGQGGDAARLGLQQAATDTGRRVPLHIANVLATADTSTPDVAKLVEDLRQHPSAAVRRAAGNSW